MSEKVRLSASVDAELLQAAQRAVSAGQADSVSAWVNDALRQQAETDRRLAAMDEFLAGFEAKHRPVNRDEMEAAVRDARAGAVVVRGRRARRRTAS